MTAPAKVTRTCAVCGRAYGVVNGTLPKFACSLECWREHERSGAGDCKPFFGPGGCPVHAPRARGRRPR